jgi:hypothetical protein
VRIDDRDAYHPEFFTKGLQHYSAGRETLPPIFFGVRVTNRRKDAVIDR